MRLDIVGSLLLAGTANAHVCAWHSAMYAFNVCYLSSLFFLPLMLDSKQGTTGTVDYNTNEMVRPMYQLEFKDFWLHHQDNVRRTYPQMYK
jgi:hypothetical protein